jgi:cephalosporin hydroxylase
MTEVAKKFHEEFYGSLAWETTRWRGLTTFKFPQDLIVYQEIIWECRPTVIIEAGTFKGGSSAFFRDMLDLTPRTSIPKIVVTIDLEDRRDQRAIEAMQDEHLRDRDTPNLIFVLGSSVDPLTLEKVNRYVCSSDRTMVVLDSNHSRDHVLTELEAYAPLVSVGQYLVVEDTNLNGHPVLPGFGPGPAEALEAWLPSHPEFEVDRSRERFMVTSNPGGWLRRVR